MLPLLSEQATKAQSGLHASCLHWGWESLGTTNKIYLFLFIYLFILFKQGNSLTINTAED